MRVYLRSTALALMLALILAACGLPQVNEETRVPAGKPHRGDINTVNGAVFVEDGARVEGDVITINGPIAVGARAEVGVLQTINGPVELHADAKARGVGSINGAIACGVGSRVAGGIATVNGTVSLDSAAVDGAIKTHNGAVTLKAGSRVGGDIVIAAQEGGKAPANALVVRIGGGSVVEGGIDATASRRPVEVRLTEGGRVLGAVSGARVIGGPR